MTYRFVLRHWRFLVLLVASSATGLAMTTYFEPTSELVSESGVEWASFRARCGDLRERDACLENPNCNWNDETGQCVDITWRAPEMAPEMH